VFDGSEGHDRANAARAHCRSLPGPASRRARPRLKRLPGLDFRGRTVLDYGCGGGCTCVTAALRGAARVLGVDIQDVSPAQAELETNYPQFGGVVEFRQIREARDIGEQRFDLILSKNTFEHVADPATYVSETAALLAPDGMLVIGFNPLWKSPRDGHIDYMTKFPWAHLLFPESVILRERKRSRPDEDPRHFEEVKGGLNRMTLAKFTAVMAQSCLEQVYFEVNRNDRPIAQSGQWSARTT
jgi:SAM-dependent methyltransferase